MTRFKLALVAVAAVAVIVAKTSEALASNTSVAVQHMTAQLFSQYRNTVRWSEWTEGQEVEGPNGPEWRGRRRELEMNFGEGPPKWEPVELRISCHRNNCTGRVWEEGPYQTYFLEDRATLRGRKGTYHESGWYEPS